MTTHLVRATWSWSCCLCNHAGHGVTPEQAESRAAAHVLVHHPSSPPASEPSPSPVGGSPPPGGEDTPENISIRRAVWGLR